VVSFYTLRAVRVDVPATHAGRRNYTWTLADPSLATAESLFVLLRNPHSFRFCTAWLLAALLDLPLFVTRPGFPYYAPALQASLDFLVSKSDFYVVSCKLPLPLSLFFLFSTSSAFLTSSPCPILFSAYAFDHLRYLGLVPALLMGFPAV